MLFEETQRFRQWWIWVIAIAMVGLTLFNVTYNRIEENGVIVKNDFSWVFSISITPLVSLFILFIVQLQTKYDEKGISYRFFPFQIQYQFKSWEEVGNAYIRNYNPLADYGGWGISIWNGKAGKAYTISGNEGIQVVYKNEKKFLLGTRKRDELEAFMQELYKKGIVKDKEDTPNIKDRY